MLKVRVIPTLLLKDVGLVKGTQFDSWRRVGSALPAVKVYNMREVDELVLLDISASEDGREPDVSEIAALAAECFVPFTIGGGIANVETVRKLLLAGADKVVVNSAAYANPQLLTESALRFGNQCIVAGIDARRHPDGRYECFSHCGNRAMGITPQEWARQCEQAGAGEILLTRIEYDGEMGGYDLELLRAVAEQVSIPVIASGGAGSYGHMLDALTQGGASAVAASAMFLFTEQTPAGAKAFLAGHGIPVRQTLGRAG